jgi:DNA repair photolyase
MLDYLHEKGIKCYVQYSLNDYEDERLEKGVKPLEYRIETFKLLYDILGRGGVVWRFDPLMLTADINVDKLLKKIENIGEQLKGFTEKLVFSFADITTYKKVKKNLDDNRIPWRDWTHEEMNEFARNLVELNKSKEWGYELATCGEKGRYPGIVPNHCVDDALIIRRGCEDQELMNFLKAEIHLIPQADLFGNVPSLPENAIILDDGRYVTRGDNRDKGQRDFCGCMKSKDIGQYNTCIHMCEYCYANTSKETAASNYKCHRNHPYSDTITGK